VICPDLRGFGWSGQPDDGDFAKARFADDMLALLDLLGIERAGYLTAARRRLAPRPPLLRGARAARVLVSPRLARLGPERPLGARGRPRPGRNKGMKAIWNGEVLAESDDTVVVEGNHYFPRESLAREHLVESEHTSWCPWKGTASYFHVEAGGDRDPDAAWVYRAPRRRARKLRDRVAFWRGVDVVPS
jgi:uncharacterized protein (DUF427 family)